MVRFWKDLETHVYKPSGERSRACCVWTCCFCAFIEEGILLMAFLAADTCFKNVGNMGAGNLWVQTPRARMSCMAALNCVANFNASLLSNAVRTVIFRGLSVRGVRPLGLVTPTVSLAVIVASARASTFRRMCSASYCIILISLSARNSSAPLIAERMPVPVPVPVDTPLAFVPLAFDLLDEVCLFRARAISSISSSLLDSWKTSAAHVRVSAAFTLTCWGRLVIISCYYGR